MRLMFALVLVTLFLPLNLHSKVLSSESLFISDTTAFSSVDSGSTYIPNDVILISDDGGKEPVKKAQVEIDCTKGSDQRLKFEKFLTAKYDEMANYLYNMQVKMDDEDVKRGSPKGLLRRVPPITSDPNDDVKNDAWIGGYDDCKDGPYGDFLYKLRKQYNWSEYEKEMNRMCSNAINYCANGVKNPYVVAGTLKDDETSLTTGNLVKCKDVPGGHKQVTTQGVEFATLGLIISSKDCPYYFDIDKTMASLR